MNKNTVLFTLSMILAILLGRIGVWGHLTMGGLLFLALRPLYGVRFKKIKLFKFKS